MQIRSVVVCSSWAALCLASSAAAAEHARRGFWIGFGFGAGSAIATCDDCGGGRETAPAGYLKLGGSLNDRVLLGGELNLWMKEEEGATLNLYNASATVTFYPKRMSGLFLKGGIGASFVEVELVGESTSSTTELGSGLGLLAGIGYDLRVARNVSITPAVNFWWGAPGDLALGLEPIATNWKQNVVDFTLGVTFH